MKQYSQGDRGRLAVSETINKSASQALSMLRWTILKMPEIFLYLNQQAAWIQVAITYFEDMICHLCQQSHFNHVVDCMNKCQAKYQGLMPVKFPRWLDSCEQWQAWVAQLAGPPRMIIAFANPQALHHAHNHGFVRASSDGFPETQHYTYIESVVTIDIYATCTTCSYKDFTSPVRILLNLSGYVV